MWDCLQENLNPWKNFEVFCITYLCQLGTEGRTRGESESYDGDEKAKVGGNRRNDMGIVVGVQRIWIREREGEAARNAEEEGRNGANLDNLQTLKGKKERRLG